ncbi:P-loop containing nucleoside triphosphate hydrolase protein [Paraphaeosphaeria sporulosa]|uniref:RNA helicase n=1 Tax=Paraphaeosphaeria sporulosa TaxID=1460663 RepID=A0A177CH39_9PLEO|nr:P-loop containing nucleoside triphosphate hydrolase protein [Paraphaeosphaeria sporulosa]OAG06884.1 P-loop containing nucleoside triphosphate hydrolase protein [Paraphaeosphaeria sporulosa]
MSDVGTNGVAVVDDAAAAASKADQKAADLQRATEAGWQKPIPFEYEAAPSEAGAADEREVKWLSDAVVYEWVDEYGEIGPRDEQLEKQLYEDPDIQRRGGDAGMAAYQAFEVLVQGMDKIHPFRDFDDAGLHPAVLENVKRCKYDFPTPIQAYCIPAVLTGHDVIGIAQTGKTAAFLLPILSKLMGKARMLAAPRAVEGGPRVRAEPLVLVVCPTRELACQIFDEARRLCYRTMLRPCVAYGGAPTKNQREQLEKGCDILVATPGRLMDFMKNPNLLSLARLKFTVIDEADELLSSGWEETIDSLFGAGSDTNVDADHTYLMFSATFSKEARKLCREYMEEEYVRIKVGRIGSTHSNIKQSIVFVEDSQKNQALFDLIFSDGPQRTLIFVNSKAKCDMVDDFLYNKGLPSTSIHSDRTQREREDALRSFRTGKCPLMVATGVSARGLDVANVKHVINYDLPSMVHDGITEYVHRIGRTARIGNEGKATSFYNDRNEDLAPKLVKLLLEAKQEVPDFLDMHKPEDPNNIEWNDGTDEESEAGDFGGDAGADAAFDLNAGFGGGDVGDFGGGDDEFKADGQNSKVDAW